MKKRKEMYVDDNGEEKVKRQVVIIKLSIRNIKKKNEDMCF